MKKFFITYIIFGMLLLIGLYFVTIIQETNRRVFELYYELAAEVKESNDLEPFIKYQSIAYRKLEQFENDQYDFYLYQVIAKEDDQYLNQFSLFVLPKTTINFASNVEDTFDFTGMIIKNLADDTILIDTLNHPDYIGYAVSHGIDLFGFYFYAEVLNESFSMEIQLTDYLGQVIFLETLDFDYLLWPLDDQSLLKLGYSTAEKETILNLNETLQPILQRNITIFLVIAFAVGAFSYHIIKNIKKDPKKNRGRS
jgi:hypothetical protein